MSLDSLLAWLPPDSPEAALAQQLNLDQLPAHIAIIMDGNGRWAAHRHLPRVEGHRAGITAVRPGVEASARLGTPLLGLRQARLMDAIYESARSGHVVQVVADVEEGAAWT